MKKLIILIAMLLAFTGCINKNTSVDTSHYRYLCDKYNLLFTAGSDFHDHVSHSEVGTSYIEDNDINKLFDKLNIK